MDFQEVMTVLAPFFASLAFVTLNEMGDKTQLLAMAFATRIRFWKVMLGVLVATLLNHGLAVTAGTLLASVPGWEGWVELAASGLFIVFGLWALKSDKLDDNKKAQKRYRGDIATVAVAFFIAEMGDKTQLATITLAASYPDTPLLVLAGTTAGMLIADGIGIVVGVLLHRSVPERLLKLIASGAFILFGLIGLWQAFGRTLGLGSYPATAAVVLIGVLSLSIGRIIYKKDGGPEHTAQT